MPGRPDSSPLWQINKVTWKAAVTPRLLIGRSGESGGRAGRHDQPEDEPRRQLPDARCFGQKRVAGFSGGRVIHYLDLGPVKVAPGNEVVLLYAPTNGAAGQHNVTHDTLAPGQTDYPTLWGIAKVTWKPGAHKRLLKSYVQIAAAKKAGELTLQRTSLVVNCPIVP